MDRAGGAPGRRVQLAVLLAVLLVAAILRFVAFGSAPPGLNQDEAANAWNACCLLKTGQDQAGKSWPIFYSRCLGANRSTLQLYVLLPFQALGGLNAWTTRAPSAVGGIITVLLTYWIAARLFDRRVGLMAAAMLAVNPWHVQQSRWGHEAALCTLLVMAPFAALLAANLPLGQRPDETRRPRVVVAALAGLLTGICCYGYPAVRIFLPIFLVVAAVLSWRGWWAMWKTKRGLAATAAAALGVALTFGPLAWQHLTDEDNTGISRRSKTTWIYPPSATFKEKLSAVAGRYPGHFSVDFLFAQGDHYVVQSVPGFGQFHWYMLPFMLIGLVAAIILAWRGIAARLLLAWVALYPVSDCFTKHMDDGMHALRASPGLCGLVLLAALGAATVFGWLWRRDYRVAVMVAAVTGIVALGLNVRFWRYFFGEYNELPRVYHLGYHVDLLAACDWLKPRFDDYDAVLCTTRGMNLPYSIALVGLSYDPERWFAEPRDMAAMGQWDVYTRFGKVWFMYGPTRRGEPPGWLAELRRLGGTPERDRVLFIIREGEMRKPPGRLVHQVIGPEGKPVLMLYEATL